MSRSKLTREEEAELARQVIQAYEEAEAALRQVPGLGEALDAKVEKRGARLPGAQWDYLAGLLNGCGEPGTAKAKKAVAAADALAWELALSEERCATWAARKLRGNGPVSEADLKQVAIIGLVRAARRFRLDRGNRFSTYATPWAFAEASRLMSSAFPVQGSANLIEIHIKLRGHEAALGIHIDEADVPEVAEQLCVSEAMLLKVLGWRQMCNTLQLDHAVVGDDGRMGTPHELIGVDPSEQVEDRIDVGLQWQRLESAVEALHTIDRRLPKVMREHFGLDGAPPRTLAAIGRDMGLSRERIRQLERRALDFLRKHAPQVVPDRPTTNSASTKEPDMARTLIRTNWTHKPESDWVHGQCILVDCAEPNKGRGLCRLHYNRARRREIFSKVALPSGYYYDFWQARKAEEAKAAEGQQLGDEAAAASASDLAASVPEEVDTREPPVWQEPERGCSACTGGALCKTCRAAEDTPRAEAPVDKVEVDLVAKGFELQDATPKNAHRPKPIVIDDVGTTSNPLLMPDALIDLLGLVDRRATREVVSGWGFTKRATAQAWAQAVHLHASDNNDVQVPAEPAHVAELPRWSQQPAKSRCRVVMVDEIEAAEVGVSAWVQKQLREARVAEAGELRGLQRLAALDPAELGELRAAARQQLDAARVLAQLREATTLDQVNIGLYVLKGDERVVGTLLLGDASDIPWVRDIILQRFQAAAAAVIEELLNVAGLEGAA